MVLWNSSFPRKRSMTPSPQNHRPPGQPRRPRCSLPPTWPPQRSAFRPPRPGRCWQQTAAPCSLRWGAEVDDFRESAGPISIYLSIYLYICEPIQKLANTSDLSDFNGKKSMCGPSLCLVLVFKAHHDKVLTPFRLLARPLRNQRINTKFYSALKSQALCENQSLPPSGSEAGNHCIGEDTPHQHTPIWEKYKVGTAASNIKQA